MAQIHLEVVTPTGPVVSEGRHRHRTGCWWRVRCPGQSRSFLSTIKTGTLSYKKDKVTKYLMVSGGFSEVSNNKITFLVESAEFGQDIDVERALRAKERAEKRLAQAQQATEKINRVRAEAALQRAMARLKTAEMIRH